MTSTVTVKIFSSRMGSTIICTIDYRHFHSRYAISDVLACVGLNKLPKCLSQCRHPVVHGNCITGLCISCEVGDGLLPIYQIRCNLVKTDDELSKKNIIFQNQQKLIITITCPVKSLTELHDNHRSCSCFPFLCILSPPLQSHLHRSVFTLFLPCSVMALLVPFHCYCSIPFHFSPVVPLNIALRLHPVTFP